MKGCRTIHGLPAAEEVEPLTLEVLKARGVRKPGQMAGGEDRFGVPEGIRRINIAFDHFIALKGLVPRGRKRNIKRALVIWVVVQHDVSGSGIFLSLVGNNPSRIVILLPVDGIRSSND
jgi:hypothetical protein